MKSSSKAPIAVCVLAAWLSGCAKNIENKDAVRQAVMNYLAKRSDLLAMDVSVASVEFRQDEATATVHFQAKGNQAPGAGMNMQYVLERNGSEWVVKGRSGSSSGNPHTGLPQGGSVAPGQTLPPGHPGIPEGAGSGPGSIGAMPNLPPASPGGPPQSGSLPPGHPAIGSGKTPDQSK